MRKLIVLCIVVGFLALAGCDMGSGGETGETGALYISVNGSMAQSILPPISMDAAAYQVTVTAADLTVIYDQEVTGSAFVQGLIPGTYTVSVIAKNDTGLAIGAGTNTAAVTVGATATCNVLVTEYAGVGTLDLTMSWPAGVVAEPNITATIAKGTALADPMIWTMGINEATYFNSAIEHGWYAVVAKLYDDGAANPSAGFATLARIVQGQVTTGNIALTPNAATGGIDILIDTDFYEEMPVTVDVAEGNYSLYSPVTITATAPEGYGTVLWAWYENGVAIDSTPALTIDPTGKTVGDTYRYDLLAFSSDGKSAWSGTWQYVPNDTQVTILYETAAPGAMVNIMYQHDGTWVDTGWHNGDSGTYTLNDLPPGVYKWQLNQDVNGDGVSDGYEYYPHTKVFTESPAFIIPDDCPLVLDFGTTLGL